MASALLDVEKGIPYGVAAKTYSVPKTTLLRRHKGKIRSPYKFGRKLALLRTEEFAIAQNLAALGDFGMAFSVPELQDFMKHYLDANGRQVHVFKENRPGIDWVRAFLARHKDLLSKRMCQNISKRRAAVSEEVVSTFFENLKTTLEGVPPSNIVNYDETNMVDDPKGQLQIFRRGTKHAERIMNSSKSATSIMFAVTASGVNLNPYVVYKAERLQQAWLEGGPVDVAYNRTKSGWFDAETFVDWFKKVALAYFRSLPHDEPKVLIGDNLASHVNHELIPLCEENNIRMVFLVPNATHILQPLDVAVFAPLKKEWRKVLTAWKLSAGKSFTTLPKWAFPSLLLQLLEAMEPQWDCLAKAGFRACGIHPFNPEHVLKKVRRQPETSLQQQQQMEHVSPRLLTYLQKTRESAYRGRGRGRGRGGRINVPAGMSISLRDLMEASSSTAGEDATTSTKETRRRLSFSSVSESEEETSAEDEPPNKIRRVQEEEEEETVDMQHLGEEKNPEDRVFEESDYVLVKFVGQGKKVQPCHYVGRVVEKLEDGSTLRVTYLRKAEIPVGKENQNVLAFKHPTSSDVYDTAVSDIVSKIELKCVTKTLYFFEKDYFKSLLVR